MRLSLPAASAKLNIYRMDLRDELVPVYYRYYDADDVLQGNAPRTVHQGLEMAFSVMPLSWLQVQGNLSYADNRFVEFYGDSLGWSGWGGIADYSGKVLPAFPKVQVKGSLTASHLLGETWAQFTHIGKQFIDFANTDSVAIAPYTLLNLATRFELPTVGSVRSELTLRVNNVFDELYETFGYTYYDDSYGWPPYRVDAYWPGATRSYFVELKIRL